MLRLLSWTLGVLLPGCAWHIEPPKHVNDPVPVFISQYEIHTGLALPGDSNAFIEYGFGEWNWYGLGRQDTFSGIRAVTGLGSGALSRRTLPYILNAEAFARAARSGRSARLLVERSDANRLRGQLEARWKANSDTVVVHEPKGMVVSRDRARYHLLANSNQAVARWLRQLGCRIRGAPLTSNFELEHVSGPR